MQKNEIKAIEISRQLTPEHQAELLVWVQLAYMAEHSVRKSLGIEHVPSDGAFIRKPQEYSCNNNARRRKK